MVTVTNQRFSGVSFYCDIDGRTYTHMPSVGERVRLYRKQPTSSISDIMLRMFRRSMGDGYFKELYKNQAQKIGMFCPVCWENELWAFMRDDDVFKEASDMFYAILGARKREQKAAILQVAPTAIIVPQTSVFAASTIVKPRVYLTNEQWFDKSRANYKGVRIDDGKISITGIRGADHYIHVGELSEAAGKRSHKVPTEIVNMFPSAIIEVKTQDARSWRKFVKYDATSQVLVHLKDRSKSGYAQIDHVHQILFGRAA